MNFKDKSHSHTVTAAVFFPSKSVQEDLVSFSHDSTQTARLVISEKMPTKILALNKLLIVNPYTIIFDRGIRLA